MKIAIRVFFLIFVVFMGFTFFASAMSNRAYDLYKEEAIPNMAAGKIDEYVENTMVMLGNQEYIKKPIHQFVINNDDFKFNFDIYHFETIEGKLTTNGLQFYLYNFESKNFIDIIDNVDNYNNNKNLVQVKMDLHTNINNINGSFMFGIYEMDTETKGSTANSLYINNETSKFFLDENNEFSVIRSLDFYIEDKTKDNGDTLSSKLIGTIESSNNQEFFEKVTLTSDSTSGKAKFHGDGLNGNASEYKPLKEIYSNNELIVVSNMKQLSAYNKTVYLTVLIYTLSMGVLTVLLFFGKNILTFFTTKKSK